MNIYEVVQWYFSAQLCSAFCWIAIARIRINQAAYLAEQMTATNALEKGGFSFKRKYTLTFNQFYQTKNERINKVFILRSFFNLNNF